MPNKVCTSINILLFTLCYLSALFLVHKIVDHKNVYQLTLIFFGSHLVAQNNLNCPVFPDDSFTLFPGLVTLNVIACFDIGIKFFPCRII